MLTLWGEMTSSYGISGFRCTQNDFESFEVTKLPASIEEGLSEKEGGEIFEAEDSF